MTALFTKADKLLIGVLVIGSLFGIIYPLAFNASAGVVSQATITVDGRLIKAISLDGHRETFRIEGIGGHNIVEVDSAGIRIIDADCPDKLCIHQGWIKNIPQMIVCLPHRVIIRISGGNAMNVDSIVR